MGLFDSIFSKKDKAAVDKANAVFQTLTAYQPAFTTWSGQLYESELVRSAIDARARHISKLQVDPIGAAKPSLSRSLKNAPNGFQTWGQFLYRLSTILDMQNTAFIVPMRDDYGSLSGYFPILPSRCELVQVGSVPYIRYRFDTGNVAAVALAECGVMTKFQYKDDFFGEKNTALKDTMGLINIQNQGIEEAVKNSATYRFMAQVTNFAKDSDIEKERMRFTERNFGREASGGGLLLFPNTYSNIQQLKATPYTVDTDQMKLINQNVYNYFGVNEKILQNSANGDDLDAFFNGAIEPFSIQLSDVLTHMTYTAREINTGNKIQVTANRLQYMSISMKVTMAKELGDRGFITINEIRQLFNYPLLPPEEGDVRPIRGEFQNADSKLEPDSNSSGNEDNEDGQDNI